MSCSEITNKFVSNFIQKDKRERTLLEVNDTKKRNKFTDKLNHKWESIFDMRFLVEIDKHQNDYEKIKRILGMADNEQCYIISDETGDDAFLSFKAAFEKINCANFGTILLNMNGDRLLLKTEASQGYTPLFVGIK